ncbi:MAG TPA: OB-fold domain-containing protein [Acidimicrobiales bacterium]|nr:OB-fold domain-containing protein [Acidimicrobiales bacterium]
MGRPLPVPDAMTAPYWEAARRGQLVVPECDACARRHFPPEARCPYCRSTWHWAVSSGEGEVYTFSVVHRGASPDFAVPYVLADVDVDGGTWTTTTNIVGCEPDEVRIGMPVRATFEAQNDEITLVLFAPR